MTEEEPLGAEREPTWDQKVVRLNAALAERGVPYAFGGAIALNYHREPRSTLDIDLNIFVSPEDEETVLATLGDVYDLADQERVKRELRREGQTRSRWGNTYVDLFLANTEFHTAMAERVERQPFGEATIPVLSIEDLLICKALFDRSKGEVARRGGLGTAQVHDMAKTGKTGLAYSGSSGELLLRRSSAAISESARVTSLTGRSNFLAKASAMRCSGSGCCHRACASRWSRRKPAMSSSTPSAEWRLPSTSL